MSDPVGPPAHLSPASAAWWSELVEEREFQSHHLRLLEAALTAWDRAEEARKVIERDGPIFQDRFGQPKDHPGVKIERMARNEFRLLLRELGLDIVGAKADKRSPRLDARDRIRAM